MYINISHMMIVLVSNGHAINSGISRRLINFVMNVVSFVVV